MATRYRAENVGSILRPPELHEARAECGFASIAAANLISFDDERRKLELVADTACKVWGSRHTYSNTTVRLPCTITRSSAWARTARASTMRSTSRPLRTRSATASRCETRITSCSIMGPSSRVSVA